MTPENEAKYKYLMRYRWDVLKVKSIEHEIIRCRLGALPGAVNYDGMPHGSGSNADLSDYAVKLDNLIEELEQSRIKTLEDMSSILYAIDEVTMADSENGAKYSILLRCKYVDDLSWKETADVMGYTENHVKGYLHGKALSAFRIPEY